MRFVSILAVPAVLAIGLSFAVAAEDPSKVFSDPSVPQSDNETISKNLAPSMTPAPAENNAMAPSTMAPAASAETQPLNYQLCEQAKQDPTKQADIETYCKDLNTAN